MKNFIASAQPNIREFLFLLFVAGTVLGLFTWSDIIINDSYVRPTLAECYPANHSTFCEERRADLQCQGREQMCIGEKYAMVIVTQVYVIGAMMFGIRIFLACMVGKKFNLMILFTAILWGFTTVALFSFGFEDYFYFTARHQDIPQVLPWLDGAGIFNYMKHYGTDPIHVDKQDLINTMFLGIVMIGVLWSMIIHQWNKKTLRTLGVR